MDHAGYIEGESRKRKVLKNCLCRELMFVLGCTALDFVAYIALATLFTILNSMSELLAFVIVPR